MVTLSNFKTECLVSIYSDIFINVFFLGLYEDIYTVMQKVCIMCVVCYLSGFMYVAVYVRCVMSV